MNPRRRNGTCAAAALTFQLSSEETAELEARYVPHGVAGFK